MRARLALAGLAAAAMAAPLALAAPARAADPGFTVTSGTLAVTDGPTGTHHVTLAYNLYVPKGVDAAHPAPAVLGTNGFGLDKDANELVSLDSFFASHGYVALAWSAQGFGTSGGCIDLDSQDYDVKDARAFIDLLQSKDYVAKDAKGAEVGMLGGSYGGAIDENTAEVDPRVRAVVASRTWNTLTYSLDPDNIVTSGLHHPNDLPGIFKLEWTSLFFALGNAQPVGGIPPTGQMKGGCAADKLASGDPTTVAGTACTGFYLAVCKTYADSAAGAVDSDDVALLAKAAPATLISQLDAPTLFTQGQSDTLFNEDDALAGYEALRARGVPTGLLWNDGGHGGYNSQPGEGEEYDGIARTPAEMDALTIPRAQLAWMDHYLRGETSVPVVGFAWYRDYVKDVATSTGASAYATADAFPVMPSTTWPLTGTMTVVAPAGGAPASYSETSNEQSPGAPANGTPATDPPGEVATFDTPAFTADEESVGVPTAHLVVSHVNPAAAVQFFAKVYDVAPDGSKTLVRRLVAPVSAPAGSTSVDVNLLGFAHEFAAGHRAELAIASTDLAYKTAGLADVLTIATGPGTSTFSLPLRPLAAGAPAVAAGPKKAAAAKKKAHRTATAAAAAKPGATLAYTGSSPVLALAGTLALAGAVTLRRRTRRG